MTLIEKLGKLSFLELRDGRLHSEMGEDVTDELLSVLEQPAQRKPLTDEQIDRAIAELGLNYFADAANNRAVLRKLCRKATHGITGEQE